MNKSFFYFIVCAMSLTIVSCKSNTKNEPTDTHNAITMVTIQPVENYFAKNKTTTPLELQLDSVAFESHFGPAATMNNKPTVINFDKDNVGAIILPETDIDTSIQIDSAFLENEALNIVYTVVQKGEKQSFTIVPSTVFTFDKNLGAKSIVFKAK